MEPARPTRSPSQCLPFIASARLGRTCPGNAHGLQTAHSSAQRVLLPPFPCRGAADPCGEQFSPREAWGALGLQPPNTEGLPGPASSQANNLTAGIALFLDKAFALAASILSKKKTKLRGKN